MTTLEAPLLPGQQAAIPPKVATGSPIEADWGNIVVDALAEHEYKINSMLPPGTVWLYAGHVAPPGWWFCDGTTAGVADPRFAALFGAIGYTYGGNASAGWFALPNFNGRFPAGVSPGDGMFWGPSAAAGSRDAPLLAHSHGMKGHWHGLSNHTHGIGIGAEGDHKHYVPGSQANAIGNTWGTKGEPAGWPVETGAGVLFGRSGMVADRSPVTGIVSSNEPFSSSPAGWFAVPIGIDIPAVWSYSANEIGAYAHTHSAWSAGPSYDGTGGPSDNTTDSAGTGGSVANANLPPYLTMNFIIRLGWP